MARATPTIRDGVLTYRAGAEERTLPVGGAGWWGWLADAGTTSFRFVDRAGGVTVRRERKSGGWYWYAYRRRAGTLRKAYLGRGEELTLPRLLAAAATLGEPRAPVPPPGPAGAAPPPDTSTGDPLLRTKLYAPPPRPDAVPRPRLIDQLAAGLRGPLTLLAAPAGAGKTTLLGAWRAALPDDAAPLAWVALDAGDNDPARFWRHVVAALDTLRPGIAADAAALLRAPQVPSLDAALTALLNAFADLPRDGALVLDDYHAIAEPAVHRGLAFLLDHLPPRLHLVLATREDPPLPLARLRARGGLVELRAADLRFTAGEAADLLAAAVGAPLAPADAAALAARTEGWAAGLQLAALALRGHADPAAFVAAFAGSHRFLIDYLGDEVLGRQPEAVRRFLRDTAVLDRLCGPLCDAVTGQAGGQAMLERLETANLFLVPLDDERRWYRYHQLFAEFLRARLARDDPGRPAALHRRAAAWHAGAGLEEEAFRHLLAAGDAAGAARLAEGRAEALLTHSGHPILLRWVAALPAAAVFARPRLGVLHAVALVWAGQLEAAEAGLADAERALRVGAEDGGAPSPGPDAAATLAEAVSVRANIAARRGDHTRAVALAREAAERLPPDRIYSRALAGLSLGNAHLAGDRPRAAREAYAAAAAACLAGGFADGAQGLGGAEADALLALGDLRAAAAGYRAILRAVADGGGSPFLAAQASFGLGEVLREWDALAEAERHLRDGLRLLRPFAAPTEPDAALSPARAGHPPPARGRLPDLLARGALRLARVRWALGDPEDAEDVLGDAAAVVERLAAARAAAALAAARARLRLLRGDAAAGAHWARAAGLGIDDPPDAAREADYRVLARALLAEGRHDAALALLGRLLEAAERAERTGSVIGLLVLRALAHEARGETGPALAALARALALGAPAGYRRAFLDEGRPLGALLGALAAGRGVRHGVAPLPESLSAYAGQLLVALAPPRAPDSRHPGGVDTLPEPLTAREREVLGLLAEGLSNPAIAARLFIGVGTVKTHLNRLFAKLGATSRTQAVARSRALGLLAD